MKKILSILSITLVFVLNLSAQEYFYYSGGEKIPLTKVVTKKVSKSLKNSDIRAINYEDTNDSTIIESTTLDIVIHHNTGSEAAEAIAVSDDLLAQDDCYMDDNGFEFAPNGTYYVKLKQQEDYSILVEIANQNGLEIVRQNRYMPLWYTLKIKSKINGSIIDVANRIYETGVFASCSPAFSFDAEEISYDPQASWQWGLFNDKYPQYDISVSEAWSFATGRGIKIAIVDSGVDINHQDLKDNILMSYDFHADTTPTTYYTPHGTHCAGIAAAKRNNGLNITGVAPDAKLLIAGVMPQLGNDDYEEELANAINWAWQNGADIISCSWRCLQKSIIEDAIDLAMSNGRNGKGSVIVKSAGNNGYISYPGTYRNDIVVVGAIQRDGYLANGSGVGPNLHIVAPGNLIWSTIPNNLSSPDCGTSMACPHVSGVIALMLERNPNLTINQVRDILAETAVKIGNLDYNIEGEFGFRNDSFGYGLVNAHQAVINTPRN